MSRSTEDLKSSADIWGDGEAGESSHRLSQRLSQSESESPTPPPTQSQSQRQRQHRQHRQHQQSRSNADGTPTDAPPSYTNATSTSTSLPSTSPTNTTPTAHVAPRPPRVRLSPLHLLSTLSSLPFQSYNLPSSQLPPPRTTATTSYTPFFSSVSSLTKLIVEQASLPPRPLMRVRGTHVDHSGRSGGGVDFDFVINLTSLLELGGRESGGDEAADEGSSSGQRERTRGSGSASGYANGESRLRIKLPLATPTPSVATTAHSRLNSLPFRREKRPQVEPTPLQKHVQSFIADKSEHKSFTLTRVVLHSSPLQQHLEGSLRTLLHTLQYRGKVEVSFPLQYEKVVVLKKEGNWVLGLLGVYNEKKWEGVESVWRWRGDYGERGGDENTTTASGTANLSQAQAQSKASEANARSVAEEFWREWAGTVHNVVLQGRRGKVSVEDWIETQMGRREKERGREWGLDGSWDGRDPWGKAVGEDDFF